MFLLQSKKLRRFFSLAIAFSLLFTLAMSASAQDTFYSDGHNNLHNVECSAQFTLASDGYISKVNTTVIFTLTDYGLNGDIDEETFAVGVWVIAYGLNNQPQPAMYQYEEDILATIYEPVERAQTDSCEMEFIFPSDLDVRAVEIRFSILNQVRDEYIPVIPIIVTDYEIY